MNKRDLTEGQQKTDFIPNLKLKRSLNLSTSFDSNPFNKFLRIIDSSKSDVNSLLKEIIDENYGNPNVNKFQFRDFIKRLNIGLTNLEIDQIVREITGPVNQNDKINLEHLKSKLNNERKTDLYNGIENTKKKIS